MERFGAFDPSLIAARTREILLGLAYLHRCGVAHRDVKGANVLVDSDGTAKLTDFGEAIPHLTRRRRARALRCEQGRVAPDQAAGTSGRARGTACWMAPEVVRQVRAARGMERTCMRA